MIICFEDMETGKCLREVPSEAKQNKLNMQDSSSYTHVLFTIYQCLIFTQEFNDYWQIAVEILVIYYLVADFICRGIFAAAEPNVKIL